jgi:hypothetical protein
MVVSYVKEMLMRRGIMETVHVCSYTREFHVMMLYSHCSMMMDALFAWMQFICEVKREY